MTLDELYHIKVESYRDFRNHLLAGFTAYTVVVGALGYFTFEIDPATKPDQFYFVWWLLFSLLTVCLPLSWTYVRHARRTANEVEEISKLLELKPPCQGVKVSKYTEDGDGMREAMTACAGWNLLAWVGSLLILSRHL